MPPFVAAFLTPARMPVLPARGPLHEEFVPARHVSFPAFPQTPRHSPAPAPLPDLRPRPAPPPPLRTSRTSDSARSASGSRTAHDRCPPTRRHPARRLPLTAALRAAAP